MNEQINTSVYDWPHVCTIYIYHIQCIYYIILTLDISIDACMGAYV